MPRRHRRRLSLLFIFLVQAVAVYSHPWIAAAQPAGRAKDVTTSADAAPPPLLFSKDDQATRVEVLRRMASDKVAGLGIALVHKGKLEWARGYGVQCAGKDKPVTDRTMFQAASLSKPVAALAALRLVEQGKLDLDQDLNAKLLSWKVPQNEFTRKRPPTLRQLLCHSAGFNLRGVGFKAETVPTLLEFLDGKPPTNTAPIRVEFTPGTKFQYSGGGYCVLQQLLIDVAGKPFPPLMQELVLGPAGMTHSTFVDPLPKAFEADAAVAHSTDGTPFAIRWEDSAPVLAAAGMWSTPADLARFIVALTLAYQKAQDPILAPDLIKAMLTRQIDDRGLGFKLEGEGRMLSFSHAGSNPGYKCYMIAFPETGQGAVVMTNSDNRAKVVMELIDCLRAEYEWPQDRPGRHLVRNSIGMTLEKIPAGEFQMGNHESAESLLAAFPAYEPKRIGKLTDETLHEVHITKPFFLAAHEVTIGQFRQFVVDADYQVESERDGTGGWGYSPSIAYFEGRKPEYSWQNTGFPQGDNHPVVNVTWGDAVAFCQWLSRREGRTYRLPTEAEWEYACRAGTTTRFSNGDDPQALVKVAALYDAQTAKLFPQWSKYAVRGSDGFEFTAPVGSFQPNGFGLYDMHGNVWEWCSDWYGEDYYAKSPMDDPQGPEKGEERVRRGASWHSWPLYMRSSYRNYNSPETRYVLVGFRVLLNDL